MTQSKSRHPGFRTTQLVFWGVVLIGMFTSVPAWPRSLEEIRKTGELRICVAGSSYELYTAMAQPFAEYLKVRPKVRRLDSWDQQFHNQYGVTEKDGAYTPALMASGECDCYPNDMVMKDWRLKKLDFVILFRTRTVVLVHKDDLVKYTAVSDLAGKSASIQKGTSYHSWLETQNAGAFSADPVQIQFMPTDECLLALDEKKVDFTLIGADGALNWTRNKVKNLSVAFPVGQTSKIGWAFRKDDKDLQEAARLFFESQASAGSRFDQIWQEKVGIPLSEFNVFITGLIED